MNLKEILILILILLTIIIYLHSRKENFDSNIALQTISSMYNNKKILSNNLEISQKAIINDLSTRYINSEELESEKINSQIINSQKITSPLLCFNNNKCLTEATINTILLASSPIINYMYLPTQCIIWSNLKSYINNDIKTVNTTFDMTYNNSKWPANDQNSKFIYSTTTKSTRESNNTGIEITIPQPPSGSNYDYNVLWVQTTNNMWQTFKVFTRNPYTSYGKYAVGLEKLNNISPDGAIHNERWDYFVWYPVPFKMSADRKIMINNFRSGGECWYSGFAFSTNPWNHCKLSALSIHWQTNKDIEGDIDNTNPAITWHSDIWNNQPLAKFNSNTEPEFKIPFVNSGNDKVFYIIEHNNSWGPGIINVSIQNSDGTNYTSLGGLYDSFNNPFARHHNSVNFQRYLGVIIPNNLLPSNINFITIKLSIPYELIGFHFREVGTHDYNPFQNVR